MEHLASQPALRPFAFRGLSGASRPAYIRFTCSTSFVRWAYSGRFPSTHWSVALTAPPTSTFRAAVTLSLVSRLHRFQSAGSAFSTSAVLARSPWVLLTLANRTVRSLPTTNVDG